MRRKFRKGTPGLSDDGIVNKMSFFDLIKSNVFYLMAIRTKPFQSRGLEPVTPTGSMNVENEDAVKEMADRYFKSGSDFVYQIHLKSPFLC